MYIVLILENTILISSEDKSIKFRASGSILKFDGFLNLYKDIDAKDEKDKILPIVKENESLNVDKILVAFFVASLQLYPLFTRGIVTFSTALKSLSKLFC